MPVRMTVPALPGIALANTLDMNNLNRFFILAGCTLAGTLATSATVFQDIDTVGIYMKKDGSDAQKKVSGHFDILVGDNSFDVTIGSPYFATSQTFDDIAGYDPNAYSITESTAFFYFRDDATDSDKEEVRIKFLEDSGDHDGGDGDGNDYEFARNSVNNKTFSIFSDSVNATIEAALQDGVLAYQIKADKGDFIFDFARLEVVATARTTPSSPAPTNLRTSIPDSGSSIGMLILGGLGLIARTQRRK